MTDATTGNVQQFSATGMFLRGWGAGAADLVQFGIPRGVAADAQGNVYVSSASLAGEQFTNSRITKLSPLGKVLAVWQ